MTPALLGEIMAHCRAESPREACGVLVWDGHDQAVYLPCRNVGELNQFEIHPEDWVAAEDRGKIMGIVHTHPGGTTTPSGADRRGCDLSGVPWWIFDESGQWERITPGRWSVLGKPFAWGIQDCFTLARDMFRGLPDFVREPEFWLNSDLFGSNLEAAGFRQVDDGPSPGDGVLLSIRGKGVPNHCAVYQGAGMIAHHLPGRLSREEYIGPLNRSVVAVVRRSPC